MMGQGGGRDGICLITEAVRDEERINHKGWNRVRKTEESQTRSALFYSRDTMLGIRTGETHVDHRYYRWLCRCFLDSRMASLTPSLRISQAVEAALFVCVLSSRTGLCFEMGTSGRSSWFALKSDCG